MKLKNKLLMVMVLILTVSGIIVTGIWYWVSKKMSVAYAENISKSEIEKERVKKNELKKKIE